MRVKGPSGFQAASFRTWGLSQRAIPIAKMGATTVQSSTLVADSPSPPTKRNAVGMNTPKITVKPTPTPTTT